ncbi:MAG: amidohydrolase, partial [Pseudomonadales bacterium]
MFKIPKIVVLVSVLSFSACDRGEEPVRTESADRVLIGGKIYTVEAAQPWAEAVAITDGHFVYVGDDAGADKYIGDATVVSDLGGRLVIPGLIDGHTHPGLMGIERYGPGLPKTTHEDLLAAIEEYADQVPDGEWIRMCCWSNYRYVSGREGPNRRELDAIVPDKPVWITSSSWHSYWLNSKALEVLNVDNDTPDPRPGIAHYVRDADGELTGWVKEGAGWQHFEKVFGVDPQQNREGTLWFLNTLSEHGVTTVYDGGNLDYEDEVYSFLAE